jgi:osomolarity two-component system sensor histidine kinase NIK1
MAGADETLVAATAVLQSLARDETTRGSVPPPPFDFEFPATNGAKSSKLPGEPSPAKVAFEAELEALMRCVHHLEFQAVSLHKLPDHPQQTTLSAIGANEKDPGFFVDHLARSLPGQGSDSSYRLTQQQILNQRDRQLRTPSSPDENFPHPPQPSAPVGDLDEDDTDEETGATRAVREEDIGILRNHVQK